MNGQNSGAMRGGGRKIRPLRKPEKGECEGVCQDAHHDWLVKILPGEGDTWKPCGNGSFAGEGVGVQAREHGDDWLGPGRGSRLLGGSSGKYTGVRHLCLWFAIGGQA